MKPTPVLLTTDVVLFGKNSKEELHVLLIQRENPPFQNYWALPGGFVDPNEDLEDAAKRELFEETSLEINQLNQFGAYGNPNRDERGRVVTVAYFAEVNMYSYKPVAKDDAKNVSWFKLNKLPHLAFDHVQIISDALAKKTRLPAN